MNRSYRKMLQNDLIQQGRHGVEHANVDTVGKQQKVIVSIGKDSFNGTVVGQRSGRWLLRGQASSSAWWQTRFRLEHYVTKPKSYADLCLNWLKIDQK